MLNTQPEESDGDRVRRLMSAWMDKTGKTQSAFAKQYKMPGGTSMISQHKSNHRPIGLEHARAYMLGFGCTLAEVSPFHASRVSSMGNAEPLLQTPPAASETEGTWPPVQSRKNLPPSLEQCIEVLALHLNMLHTTDNKEAAKTLLSTLVNKPALHANVASTLEQLCKEVTAKTAAA